MENKEFFAALTDLVREKGISEEAFIATLENALASAYKKQFDGGAEVAVSLDAEKGTIEFKATRYVVEEVEDKDKEISLTCKVEPWTVVADTIDFSDQITISNPITWVPNSVESVDYNKGEVVLYTDSYSVAVCDFRIDTPAGATWTASLIPIEGYSDAFKILDNTKYGTVGVDSEIHIQVTNMAPIAPRHVVLLRITVQTADGRTIVADMMPDETDESVTEYKLIQNLING